MARDVSRDFARDWMWSEACEMLARAERMHRDLFRPGGPRGRGSRPGSLRSIFWRPTRQVLVLVALPGVDPEKVEAVIEDSELVIGGTRAYPAALRTAIIHRLELPQGRFHRRLRLPRRALQHGAPFCRSTAAC